MVSAQSESIGETHIVLFRRRWQISALHGPCRSFCRIKQQLKAAPIVHSFMTFDMPCVPIKMLESGGNPARWLLINTGCHWPLRA